MDSAAAATPPVPLAPPDLDPHSAGPAPAGLAKPLLDAPQSLAASITMWLFVIGPLPCLLVAVPLAWGWEIGRAHV